MILAIVALCVLIPGVSFLGVLGVRETNKNHRKQH